MIEAAMLSNNTIPIEIIEKIVQWKEPRNQPFCLASVEETLAALHGKYKLVVATKGDLLDQRKLQWPRSSHYFHILKWCQTNKRHYNW
jgi:putative hydrolase of the HAD superfamily